MVFVILIFANQKVISDPIQGSFRVFHRILNNYSGLLYSLNTIASAVVGVGLILIIIKIRNRATIAEYLDLRRITKKTILILLAITTGILGLSDILSLILGKSLYSLFILDAYYTSIWPALLWIAAVILGPLSEEVFYRGFLFAGFRQSRIGVAGTIGLTALIWALMHVQYNYSDSFEWIATIFVLGIVLGITRVKTGSLWSPLLMHMFWNLIMTLKLYLNINSFAG
ncbi:lysostaphin resistance A-like protein [Chloroflexota bacterium]